MDRSVNELTGWGPLKYDCRVCLLGKNRLLLICQTIYPDGQYWPYKSWPAGESFQDAATSIL